MILIIGNFLTVHGYNPTFLELLANDLKLRYNVYCVAKKKNKSEKVVKTAMTDNA